MFWCCQHAQAQAKQLAMHCLLKTNLVPQRSMKAKLAQLDTIITVIKHISLFKLSSLLLMLL